MSAGSTSSSATFPLAVATGSEWRRLVRRTRQMPLMAVGAAILLLVLVCGIVPRPLERYDPTRGRLLDANRPPSATYWLGTDTQGRDVYSRVVAGARASLLMGVVPVTLGLVIGAGIGLVAGYYQRLGDLVLMRVIDLLMAFPGIVLALTIVAALGTRHGSNAAKAMLAIGIALVPTFARVTRGAVLAAKEQLYVAAARAVGCSDWRVMVRHLFPNVIAPLIVLGTLAIATSILAGAALSFLGLGAQPPSIDWGSMINDGRQQLATAWWVSTFPGLILMLVVVGINLLGDGFRDLLDPRLRL